MGLVTHLLTGLLACSSLVAAAPSKSDNGTSTCTTKTQRKAWHKMTNTEKSAYIDAELCLMSTPATLGLAGTQNKFDELLYCHVWQSNVIHYSVSVTSIRR